MNIYLFTKISDMNGNIAIIRSPKTVITFYWYFFIRFVVNITIRLQKCIQEHIFELPI